MDLCVRRQHNILVIFSRGTCYQVYKSFKHLETLAVWAGGVELCREAVIIYKRYSGQLGMCGAVLLR